MIQILFITPYYPPEKGAPQIRISETAQRLVQRGYHVTILTTVPNYPTGLVAREYRGHLVQEEMIKGVRVVRVWSYISPNKGFFRRILAQFAFAWLAPMLGWKRIGHPDVIIVESPPLFDAFAGRMLAWLKRCPFIFTVSDVWPESAVQLGILRQRSLIRLAEWLEWSTYRRAARVWAVTEGIRHALIARGLPSEQVFVLTNGVDTKTFRSLPQVQARTEFGLNGCFIVLYAGTHGIAQGLTTVLDAAQLLRERSEIHFVLVGDGSEKNDLVASAQQRGLENITFFDPLPHERMPLLLAACDICLVPLRKVPLFAGALPSKMYEAMACARPMILGVEGEAHQLVVQEAGAAIAVEPENASALASAILRLYEQPEETARLGERGRALVEARFDRDQLVEKLEAHILALLNKPEKVSLAATSHSVE